MDKDTAQALTELARTGRFSDETHEAIHAALGQQVDEDSGLVIPQGHHVDRGGAVVPDEDDKPEPAKQTAKR